MAPKKERRSGVRVPFYGAAIINAAGRRIACKAIDLSISGMLLLPPAKAKAGLDMQVSFAFPGLDQWISVHAVLVRETTKDNNYAWGIRFRDVPPFVTTYIQNYVRSRSLGDSQKRIGSGSHPSINTQGKRPITGPSKPATPSPLRAGAQTASRIKETDLPSKIGVQTASHIDESDLPSKSNLPPRTGLKKVPLDPFADLPIKRNKRKSEDIEETPLTGEIPIPKKLYVEDSTSKVLRRLFKDAVSEVGDKKKKKKGWFW